MPSKRAKLFGPARTQVEWEERWWEASDWAGMREMGAEKAGVGADGSAWRETWREAIAFDAASGQPIVERSAHKWAHDAKVGPHRRVACRRIENSVDYAAHRGPGAAACTWCG